MKISLLLPIFALTLAATPARAQMSRFLGNWDAADSTDQVARVLIAQTGTQVTVHVWGRCTPRLCDWGEQPAVAYSTGVADDPFEHAEAVLADFRVPQVRSITVVRPAGEDEIEVEAFTQFTDGSGRMSYLLHNRLRRTPEM
jgi:hypothetical protein